MAEEVKQTETVEKVNVGDSPKAAEPTPAAEQPKTTGTQYRYVCEACSGIAYYGNGDTNKHPVGNCRNCGAALSEFKPENLVELTENEKEQLRALK